jgi:hypothetical protein
MPNRKQFKSNEEYNTWFREYNAKNKEKIQKYKREWMRNYRENQKKGLQESKKVK